MMEMEAKVRLPTLRDYTTVKKALSKWAEGEDMQENHFFDGLQSELQRNGAVFRIRFAHGKCLVSLKEHGAVSEGSSLRWGSEEEFDATIGREAIKNPSVLTSTAIFKILSEKFDIKGMTYLGGFRNLRTKVRWETAASQPGLMIRLDHTQFPFGDHFEIEVPGITVPVADVIEELRGALEDVGVDYTPGCETKFQHFMAGLRKQAEQSHMEMEVKFTMAEGTDYQKVVAALSANKMAEDHQENHFFDSHNGDLQKAGAVLRLRFVGDKCLGSLKEHSGIADGSAMRWAQEEELSFTRDVVQNPNLLFSGTSAIVADVQKNFNVSSFVHVGGFRNVRTKFSWNAQCQPGLTLHVDHTTYPFGERYEIEVPSVTVPVHDVIDELRATLDTVGVHYALGTESKFTQFINGLKKSFRHSEM